jgi:hypothetical protein
MSEVSTVKLNRHGTVLVPNDSVPEYIPILVRRDGATIVHGTVVVMTEVQPRTDVVVLGPSMVRSGRRR